MNEEHAELDALELAREVLAYSREGILQFGEHRIPLKFVADNATGRLIASVPVAAILAADHTLFVPEETDDALQLMLTPEEIQESLSTDRWMAHHGPPDHVRWAEFFIESAKHGPWVFDGEALMVPNPAAAAEPALCKLLNTDKAKLARLCQRFGGTVVPDPTCVAVDGEGIYVRARFGVIRVPLENPGEDGAAVEAEVKRMLSVAG